LPPALALPYEVRDEKEYFDEIQNILDLMDALKKSFATESTAATSKKPRKAAAGQKEMLLSIEGKGRPKKVPAKADKAAT